MTNVIDEASSLEPPPVLHRSSRRFAWFFSLAAVSIGLCAGAAYFGINAEAIFEKPSAPEAVPTTSCHLKTGRHSWRFGPRSRRQVIKLERSTVTSARSKTI